MTDILTVLRLTLLHVPARLCDPEICKLFVFSQFSLPLYYLFHAFCLKYSFTETKKLHIQEKQPYSLSLLRVSALLSHRRSPQTSTGLNTLCISLHRQQNKSLNYILTWHFHQVEEIWATCSARNIVSKRHELAACNLNDSLRVVCRLLWRMVSLYANKY